MKNKFTQFIEDSYIKDSDCPPFLDSQKAIDFLCDYLLGENYYIINPISTTQVDADIVFDILKKYSKKFRKEYKKYLK